LTLRLIRAVCASLLVSLTLAACGGGQGVDVSSPSTSDETDTTGSIARTTISGTPATSITVGTQYSFTPTASDTDGGTLTYAITNAPAWATFNAQTGQLSGSPKDTNVGTTTGIVITAADGSATASLPVFSIVVVSTAAAGTGSATVTWVAPTENSNGTALTDLAGYYVYYGTDASSLTESVQVSNAGALSYKVTGLATGTTWYFAVASYTSADQQSALSTVSSKSL
jgi:Putative Ig domain